MDNIRRQPVSFFSSFDILSGRVQPGVDPEDANPDSLAIRYVRPNVALTSTRGQSRAETALHAKILSVLFWANLGYIFK